jgi:hypothetical protein
MPRRHLQSKLSGEQPSLETVWAWYEFQNTLIGEEAVRTLEALREGAATTQPRYFGRTREELLAFFDDQRKELKFSAMLSLLAATEAALRVDYIARVMNKKKDAVSQTFSELYREQRLKVSLEDQILDVWKQHSPRGTKDAVSRFKGVLILRHWIAHGRYWKPKLGQDYTPVDVFEVCDSLLRTTIA